MCVCMCVCELCINARDEEIHLMKIPVVTCDPVCICSYYVVKRISTCRNCQNCNRKNSFKRIYLNRTHHCLCEIVLTNLLRESLLFYSSFFRSHSTCMKCKNKMFSSKFRIRFSPQYLIR